MHLQGIIMIQLFAWRSGKCSTHKIAGGDFACKSVAYFHSQQGRANFTVVLNDPTDASHIISFSGEDGRREQNNLYALPIDRMLLKSKDRSKIDGAMSQGLCCEDPAQRSDCLHYPMLSGGWPITDETIARMAALLWRFSDSEIA
jgi:hypothetical protein